MAREAGMATINFIPNDPLAVDSPPMRRIQPPRYPTGTAARFSVQPSAAVGLYQPPTPAFDFWQTQTALIFGLRVWRAIDGAYLPRWFGNQAVLPVKTNAGDDLNAFYDRDSLQFFSHTFGGKTVHSCESVDVVVHEEGHAFLDAIRPDFFDVPYVEAGALHEAIGDCVALLAALSDAKIRARALQLSPDLGSHQFVERLAEQLGDAIKREYGANQVDPGALRCALNTLRWRDPTTLPASTPAAQLSREVHNFSRVFTGCFYDVIRALYLAGTRTPAALGRAAVTAGKLLVSALRTVPATPRLFEGVGQRMLQADVGNNAGVNVSRIRSAFAAHGIALAAPARSLLVPLTTGRAAAAVVAGDLRARLGLPRGAKMQLTSVRSDMHGQIAHVTGFQPMTLTGAGLRGLQILVPAVARVQTRGAAIVGLLGEPAPIEKDSQAHAQAFAQALVANGDVELGKGARAVRRAARPTSHVVKMVGGKPTIVRRGFVCGCRPA